jgi:hypothetical protein
MNPLVTVVHTIQSSTAAATPLPPSAPGSGFNTPSTEHSSFWSSEDGQKLRHRVRVWSLEWLSICVQELGRAAIGEQKAYVSPNDGELTSRLALRKHIEMDMKVVMATITECMAPAHGNADREKEAEAACQCAESWVTYGIGGE